MERESYSTRDYDHTTDVLLSASLSCSPLHSHLCAVRLTVKTDLKGAQPAFAPTHKVPDSAAFVLGATNPHVPSRHVFLSCPEQWR